MARTELHDAADNCCLEDVKTILAAHPSYVHERDADGDTPLRLTVSIGVAEALISAGADVHTANNRDLTPLHKAAASYNAGLAVLYLQHGAKVASQSNNGVTPLISAAMFGNEYQMALLLVRGADPRHVDGRGQSAISEIKAQTMRDACLLLGALRSVMSDAPSDQLRSDATNCHTELLGMLSASMIQPLTPPGDIVLEASGRGELERWERAVAERCRELRAAVPQLAEQLENDQPDLWEFVQGAREALSSEQSVGDPRMRTPQFQDNLRALLAQFNVDTPPEPPRE